MDPIVLKWPVFRVLNFRKILGVVLTRMKSLPALIWSCCISVLTPSSSSLWGVFCLSSAPLLLLRVILPLLFPRDYVWVFSLSSSQPSGFDAYLSLPTLYVMLPHLPLGVLPCSPLLQGAVVLIQCQLLANAAFFLLLLAMLIWLPDILIMSWSSTYSVQWSSWKVYA